MCPMHLHRARTDKAAIGPFGRAGGSLFRTFALARTRAAVTAIEYALMGALVALAIIGGVNGYAGNLGALMTATFSAIGSAM